MQAIFQKYVDNAISKTINLKHDSTVENVKKIYIDAYRMNLKGVTIYRDRSKDNQTFISSKIDINKVKKAKREILIGTKNKYKYDEINSFIETLNEFFYVSKEKLNFDNLINKEEINISEKALLEDAIKKSHLIGKKTNIMTICDESGITFKNSNAKFSIKNVIYFGKDNNYSQNLFKFLKSLFNLKPKKAYLSCALALFDPSTNQTITTTTKIPGKLFQINSKRYKYAFIHEGLDKLSYALSKEEFRGYNHRYKALQKLFDKYFQFQKDIYEINLSKNALHVLEKRSLRKDNDGNITETPTQLFSRIANYVAKASLRYKKQKGQFELTKLKFFEILKNLEFLCGGALIWAGMSDENGKKAILSKCFVLPIHDSVSSIFKTLNDNIEILKHGGGTGFNFSEIRSTFAKVKTTGENAAGPIEYLKVYNRAQDTIIGRGGRKMGSMAILNIDHPNIIEFIEAKKDPLELTHYNLSVGITRKFFKSLEQGKKWQLIDPHTKAICKEIDSSKLFNLIAESAWKSGDPGLIFLDNLRKGNTTPHLGEINATNVCGEQPLLPYESCNLGNINLSKIVKGFPYLEDYTIFKKPLSYKLKYINWKRFEEIIRYGVEFLDDLIDINNYPILEIEKMTKTTRSIGLGIMGFADMCIKLGIPYSSEQAIKLGSKIMKFLSEKAHEASQRLGKIRGNFPAFKGSLWHKKKIKYMRNARCTTVAPTGTVSIVADCNPGIEPIFSIAYIRKQSLGGENQIVIDPLFEQIVQKRIPNYQILMKELTNGKSLQEISYVPKDIKDVFKTSHEIIPEQHLKIQAAFQKYCDSGVSKTINLPKNSTIEDIKNIFLLAYKAKLKGITVFREGCKDETLEKIKEKNLENSNNTKILKVPRPRPITTRGITTQVKTEQGSLYVTINEDEEGIVEVFLTIGKSGGYSSGYCEAIGRLISVSVRAGLSLDVIIGQLKGIRTSSPTLNKGMFVYSVPDAIAKVLENYKNEKEGKVSMFKDSPKIELKSTDEIKNELSIKKEVTNISKNSSQKDLNLKVRNQDTSSKSITNSKYSDKNIYDMLPECPECGADLVYAEGCMMCQSCGYSKCG